MSLTPEQLNTMTLAEILIAMQLPVHLLAGDQDHEDTTDVLDNAVRNWREE